MCHHDIGTFITLGMLICKLYIWNKTHDRQALPANAVLLTYMFIYFDCMEMQAGLALYCWQRLITFDFIRIRVKERSLFNTISALYQSYDFPLFLEVF